MPELKKDAMSLIFVRICSANSWPSVLRYAVYTCTKIIQSAHCNLNACYAKRDSQIQPLITPSLSFCLTRSIHCFPFPRMPPLALLLTALNSKRLRSSFSRKFIAVAGRASVATEPISSANMNGLLFVEKPPEVLVRPSPRVCGAM
jgi:hypothetical protein